MVRVVNKSINIQISIDISKMAWGYKEIKVDYKKIQQMLKEQDIVISIIKKSDDVDFLLHVGKLIINKIKSQQYAEIKI